MGGTPRTCPTCGSTNVAHRKKQGDFFCGDCDHAFPAESATRPRLFLSYARSDDEPFVRKLYEHLTVGGFDVWWDRVSMPNRGLAFTKEIADAIAGVDRVLFICGPAALLSDYVTREWTFALEEACKVITTLMRIGRRRDLPDQLRPFDAFDFTDDSTYGSEFERLLIKLRDPVPPLAHLIGVPDLPPHLIRRHDRLAEIKEALRADFLRPVGITAQALRPGLQGMGGIGKSVLAKVLAHDGEIRRMFPDGIAWITIGQNADERIIHTLQQKILRGFNQPDDFGDVYVGKSRLKQFLQDKRALVILDDVWRKDQAEAFDALGPLCRMMVTTRDAGLVHSLGGKQYAVELLSESEARVLLAKWAEVPVGLLDANASRVIEFCGRLPLALAISGAMIRKGTRWTDLVTQFEAQNLKYIKTREGVKDYPFDGVHAAVAIGVDALSPGERDRFAELSVFPADRASPEDAVHTLWAHTGNMADVDSRELLNELNARSLVILDATQGDHRPVRLHTLLHAFSSRLRSDHKSLHQVLLNAYLKKCDDGQWPTGPNDGYYLQNLCRHLIDAELLEEAISLLIGIRWIDAKSRVGLVFSLQDDYRQTLAAMPEAQNDLAEAKERESRLARWAAELTAYALAWSDRRERAAEVNAPSDEPRLPELPVSCRAWTDEEIAAECRRMVDHPTRLDRLQAFGAFVESECYPLLNFGAHPGFAAQHACNRPPGDPVRGAAYEALNSITTTIILRRWPAEARWVPKPATLRTLEGHNRMVGGVSITLDGRRAVSTSSDKTLRVWDLESGQCILTLEGHLDSVRGVSVTSDGRRAISASEDKTLRLWDLENGQCLRTFTGHGKHVTGVSMTPDGRLAVSASSDKTLRVWDVESGECRLTLMGHLRQIWSVAVTPDGRRAVSASYDGTLRVWNLETGQSLHTLKGHFGSVDGVSVTPDCRRAVSAGRDKTVRLWDLESGRCLRIFAGHADAVRSVSITPDGRCAVSASADQMLRLWDLENGRCLRTLAGHAFWVSSVSITPDGLRAVSGSWDQTLRVWNLESGQRHRTFEMYDQPLMSLNVTPDGKLAVSSTLESSLGVWDPKRGHRLRKLEGHKGPIARVAITPDSRRAISASEDKTLRVWDLESGQCICILEGHDDQVASVSVAPDGRRAVSASHDQTLRVWDLESSHCRWTLNVRRDILYLDVTVTPDGRRAVSVSSDRNLRVWDLGSGQCLHTMKRQGTFICCVSVTPDGQRAVSAGFDGTLLAWDLTSGHCSQMLKGHGHSIKNVSITPDGQRAVSASFGGPLHVWDLQTGQSLPTPGGLGYWKENVTITRDGRRAVCTSEDKTLRMWDLESGRCLGLFAAPVSITAGGFISDGRSIVVGARSGEVFCCDLTGDIEEGAAICTAHSVPNEPGLCGRCPACGSAFTVPESAAGIVAEFSVESLASPSSRIAMSDRDDPRLLATCPHCDQALKFNPFYVDTSDAAHESRLRHGLKCCVRDLGDHPDAAGHLAALAYHLQTVGHKEEAADLNQLHAEMAQRLKDAEVPSEPDDEED